MTTTKIKPIICMNVTELNEYIVALWATYFNIPMYGEQNLRDISVCLCLIGKCQARRKVLRNAGY